MLLLDYHHHLMMEQSISRNLWKTSACHVLTDIIADIDWSLACDSLSITVHLVCGSITLKAVQVCSRVGMNASKWCARNKLLLLGV